MPANWSIKSRLLLTGSIVVGLFMLLTGLGLDQAFHNTAEQARSDRLLARAYMLMAITEVRPDASLVLPELLPDPDLAVPASGAYGSVSSASGAVLWQSDSSLNDVPAYPIAPEAGSMVLQQVVTSSGVDVATLSLPVIWEQSEESEISLVFQAGEDTHRVDAEVQAFRATLQKWLGGAGIILIALQLLMLIWVIRPLSRVAEEITKIESGDIAQLSANYPLELTRLTDPLNKLIKTNETRLKRYRNSLSDLAHSLKTPLASARISIESSAKVNNQDTTAIFEQIDTINNIIQHQLQRASMSGRSPLAKAIEVENTVGRIVNSMKKVYHDKSLSFEVDVAPGTMFRGDPGDLIEIVGNLCDNASKWAAGSVRIQADNIDSPRGILLRLIVSDDGPGIPQAMQDKVLGRGIRADTGFEGQGIGLAAVNDMIDIYDGSLEIRTADLGGAELCIKI
jgi:two-component system sensor histidine kinase PhoQ